MSSERGRLDCVNVSDLSFIDGGGSLRITLVASVPPHNSTTLILRNAYSIRLSQSPGDEYPYFVPEIVWEPIPVDDSAHVLREANYDFFDADGNPLVAGRQLFILKLEGALCGEIIAEAIEYE